MNVDCLNKLKGILFRAIYQFCLTGRIGQRCFTSMSLVTEEAIGKK